MSTWFLTGCSTGLGHAAPAPTGAWTRRADLTTSTEVGA